MTPLFLTTEEVAQLTGYTIKRKQVEALRSMGVVFRVNPAGTPIVTRAAVEGHGAGEASKQKWQPAI
ncbi:DUF4224 domain-containing protein [Aquitalea sp. ASV11]|uniref:DUF4224 domain-containing protein n=1 Tax=Aquitalea sp. ASV11 TaxID=2795103 RepID=UPI0018EA908F|nr:DUF4224 domain-containing protein [Aquitalea sp. ASV11]